MQSSPANKPREIFRAHPVLGWTLSPGAEVNVRFRPGVLQKVDDAGNRVVPMEKSVTEQNRSLHCYGCSFTYGTGLADSETYPALLQKSLPEIKVSNKGVGGYSTVQALLRFRADLQREPVTAAVFGVISHHRYRNFPHPKRMHQHLSADWYRIGVEHVPNASLDRSGNVQIRYTPIWQPALKGDDFSAFLPDEYALDLITIAVFREIETLARQYKVPVLFALLDQHDPEFNQLMLSKFPAARDISTPHDRTHRLLPHDGHPNPHASELYTERLLPAVQEILKL